MKNQKKSVENKPIAGLFAETPMKKDAYGFMKGSGHNIVCGHDLKAQDILTVIDGKQKCEDA